MCVRGHLIHINNNNVRYSLIPISYFRYIKVLFGVSHHLLLFNHFQHEVVARSVRPFGSFSDCWGIFFCFIMVKWFMYDKFVFSWLRQPNTALVRALTSMSCFTSDSTTTCIVIWPTRWANPLRQAPSNHQLVILCHQRCPFNPNNPMLSFLVRPFYRPPNNPTLWFHDQCNRTHL